MREPSASYRTHWQSRPSRPVTGAAVISGRTDFFRPLEGGHFWRALRYVERNPVWAAIVRRVALSLVERGDALRLGQQPRWPAGFGGVGKTGARSQLANRTDLARTQEEMEALRRHTQTRRPLTREKVLEVFERQTGRRLRPLPVGRPPKKAKEGRLNT